MSVRRLLVAPALAIVMLAGQVGPTTAPRQALAQSNVPLQATQVARRSVEVFGYLPYWEIDSTVDAYLRYRVLSTIALFGVAFRADGSLNTTDSSYRIVTGSTAATVIRHAHAAGVRVVMTFESFNADHNAQFLSDTKAQSTFIANAIALLRRTGVDGLSLDIEGLSRTWFPQYGQFAGAVREAVMAYDPAAQVSVATNGALSGAQMAAAASTNGIDRIFLMGYGYRSANSPTVGSIDPLVMEGGGQSLTWSLDTYAANGVPARHLILGLPLYGRRWPTTTSAALSARQPAATYGGGVPVFVKDVAAEAKGMAVGYDTIEQSAVLTGWDTTSSTWTQVYYDDPAALAPKAQLALRRGLAGVGLWALGYDRGLPGFWSVLASLHRGLELSHISITPFRTHSLSVTVRIGWKSAGHPVTGVRLSNNGTTWTGWRRPAPNLAWTLSSGSDAMRTVYVQVRDSSGAVSTVRPVDVVLDRHGPAMTTLTMAWSSSTSRWVARFRATDLSGVAGYQFRYRIGAGTWKDLSRSATGTTVRIGTPRSAHLTVEVRGRDVTGLWGPWKSVSVP
jgi:spore germination protein YaaH